MVGSELTTWVVPSARCPNGCGLREPQFHAAQRAQCGTSGTVLWKRQRLPWDCGGLWVGISVGMGEMVVDLMHIFWWFGYENKLSLFIYIYLYIYVCVSVCVTACSHTKATHVSPGWGNCPCGFAWGDSNGSLAIFFLWRLMLFVRGVILQIMIIWWLVKKLGI